MLSWIWFGISILWIPNTLLLCGTVVVVYMFIFCWWFGVYWNEVKSKSIVVYTRSRIVLLFLVALSTILSVEVLLNYGFDHWEMIAPFKLFSFLVIYVGWDIKLKIRIFEQYLTGWVTGFSRGYLGGLWLESVK